MKSTVGKVSAIMILLTFMLASVFVLNIALAQNETNALENVTINETVDNGTASWDFVEEISLNETVENVTLIPNETSNETSLSNFTNETDFTNETNITNETVFNETVDLDVSLNDTDANETNVTSNETNITIGNITLNETNTTNETLEENETLDEITEPIIEPVAPTFDVKLLYPQKITRGENIKISADLTSDSFAKNVYMKWVLPDGFEIISGNEIETCGDLDSNISCSSEIDVRTNLSVLGLSEIKVVVSYEK